jgi:hypothetical protein
MAQQVIVNRTYQATLETGTTALTGTWIGFTTITATVFTTLTGMGGDALAGVTFPAGVTYWGNFTAVTLASGSVVLYESPR